MTLSLNLLQTRASTLQIQKGQRLTTTPQALRVEGPQGGALAKILTQVPLAFARLPANQGGNVALDWNDLQTEAGLSRAGSVWTRSEGVWKMNAVLHLENTSLLSLGSVTWAATGDPGSSLLDRGVETVAIGGFGQIVLQALFQAPFTPLTLALSASIALSNISVKEGSSVSFQRIG